MQPADNMTPAVNELADRLNRCNKLVHLNDLLCEIVLGDFTKIEKLHLALVFTHQKLELEKLAGVDNLGSISITPSQNEYAGESTSASNGASGK